MARFDPVAEFLQQQVDGGRLPGCVAALRHRGATELIMVGRTTALTLALADDGVLDLDDEVARRPITVRHLLTNTAGIGWAPDIGPLAAAMDERGVGPDGFPPLLGPDEYLRRLAELPLSAQPGEVWGYHVGSEVLAVLLARATGRTVGELLAERLTGPLGLADTAFTAVDPSRLAVQYWPTDGGLEEADGRDGVFSRPPAFESLATGLVSSAPDVLAFLCAVADGGGTVLSRAAAAEMTRDAVTPEQWAPVHPWQSPGRWGWDGGTGTSGWVDPSRDLAAVLLTQRGMASEHDAPDDFRGCVHRCL